MENSNQGTAGLQADENVARATNENEGNTPQVEGDASGETNNEVEIPLGEQIDSGNDEFSDEGVEPEETFNDDGVENVEETFVDNESDARSEVGGEA